MLERIKSLREKAIQELEALTDSTSLEEWKRSYLGKKGLVTQLLRQIGSLPPEERPKAGEAANLLRDELTQLYEEKASAIKEAERLQAAKAQAIDVTLPGRRPQIGALHPVTQTLREIIEIFSRMGFGVYEGPEVEWDDYNFGLLNIPPEHPARDMWDTLYIAPPYGKEGNMLLRTHTSPDQIRVMELMRPPIRVVVPGRCYRHEATDASHEWMFYQVEGLAVDKGITMAHLKGVLTTFVREMFGKERKVRFRCDYFPFVEPGADMAMDCIVCGGKGCRVCKFTGWLEILGAGMVHPQVLRNVGIDPNIYTGFAFGMGVERIAMLKHKIDDIRYFYANDLRFLKQFRA